jgi:hypothetical protein
MRTLLINLAVIVVVLFAVKSFAADTVTTTVGTAVVSEAPQTNPCPVNYVPVFSPINGKTMFCAPVPKNLRTPVTKE